MILNNEYCNNEKYYNSIKYFYHLEESEEKKDIILEKLIEFNIVLASICVVSDKRNIKRESKLIQTSKAGAEDFSNEEKSIKALLALAELKQFSIILNIFNELKPQVRHKQILREVFQQADEGVFFKFIESFTNYHSFNEISTEFLFYSKKIIPNKESIEILKKFVKFLNDKKLVGFIRIFLEKYELLGQVGYFYDETIESLIIRFLSGEKKEVFLGYSILIYNNYSDKIDHDTIIKLLCQTKNNKTLKLAIDFAIRNNIYDNHGLNEKLKTLITLGKKKSLGKLIYWLKNGLYEFCKNSKELYQYLKIETDNLEFNLDKYENQNKSKNYDSKIENYESIIDQFNSNEGVDRFVHELLDLDFNNQENLNPLALFWCRYSLNTSKTLRNIPIEVFIERSLSIFDTDMQEICHVLREFQYKGQIVNENEHGYFIRSNDFRSLRTLFLHREMCPKSFIRNRTEIDIVYRIVGYNLKAKKINISLLNVDELKDRVAEKR
ncbi:MAG: hypothetical protein SFY56_13720 [Bacteroidota bacterium]|nr:hypothetical protein [Bacteroidota bacterium]